MNQTIMIDEGSSLKEWIKTYTTLVRFAELAGRERSWIDYIVRQKELSNKSIRDILDLINSNSMELLGGERKVTYDEVFNFSPSSVTNSVGKGNLQTGDNSTAMYEEKAMYDSREMADMRMQLQVKDKEIEFLKQRIEALEKDKETLTSVIKTLTQK